MPKLGSASSCISFNVFCWLGLKKVKSGFLVVSPVIFNTSPVSSLTWSELNIEKVNLSVAGSLINFKTEPVFNSKNILPTSFFFKLAALCIDLASFKFNYINPPCCVSPYCFASLGLSIKKYLAWLVALFKSFW